MLRFRLKFVEIAALYCTPHQSPYSDSFPSRGSLRRRKNGAKPKLYAVIILNQEHCIPKGEESILLLHRFTVGVQHIFSACKSGNEHNKRTFREMEIGDQALDTLELITGIDENIRPAGTFLNRTVIIST